LISISTPAGRSRRINESTVFGVGVNINLDPRSPGLYLDDKLAETLIMKKIVQHDYKQIFLNVKVIDGTAILSGRV